MIYELSHQAQADIEEIIRYTDNNFGPAQTDQYIEGLYYSFELLTDNPRMGHTRKGEKRRYIYRMHNVYYRIIGERIFITQLRHSSQQQP